ncbi:hypothetical protein [Pseudarthrobacter sp. S9]|uniref:hypothetical protein n=1 Tax=Pseudarthrobacter sp. S9 TaxID=3418421 RepID=UPI003CFC1B36
MSIITERLEALNTITLDKGAHSDFESGHCAMEVVSWLAGLGFTDAPECASSVLRTFTINLNDQWGTEDRQRLVPFLPRMVGTAGDGKDEARSYMALDWLIRTYTPAFLDLANLSAEAQALRDLRRIVDLASAEAAGPVVRAGREKASAAWVAARVAARVAAWVAARVAAGDAAWVAARDAAWDAAWVAAGDAAWVAARVAAGDAARDAARVAARVAAWVAAGDAAWVAARVAAGDAAWVAARDAAWDALAPTVETLKTSALELLDRMIDPDVTQ